MPIIKLMLDIVRFSFRLFFKLIWATTLIAAALNSQRAFGQANRKQEFDRIDAEDWTSYSDVTEQLQSLKSVVPVKLCQLPNNYYPVNKIEGASYGVTRSGKKTFLRGDKLITPELAKNMSAKITRNSNIASIVSQRVNERIKTVLGEDEEYLLTREAEIIYNKILPIVADGAVQLKTKEGDICGQSVNRNMGRIITYYKQRNIPMPTMIAFSVAFDFDHENDPRTATTPVQHFFDQHITLLVVDDSIKENQDLLSSLNDYLAISKDDNDRVVCNHQKLFKLIEEMNPQVCDAWVPDHDALNTPREENNFFTFIKENPERIRQLKILTHDDLTFSPLVERVVDDFFTNPNLCQMWLDEEDCGQQFLVLR